MGACKKALVAGMKRKSNLKIATPEIKEEETPSPMSLPEATAPDPIESTAPKEDSANRTTKTRRKTRRPVLSDTIPAIPMASFSRMARSMANDCKSDLRWEADALEALQVAAEAFMVEKFQKAGDTSRLFSRKTVAAELLRA